MRTALTGQRTRALVCVNFTKFGELNVLSSSSFISGQLIAYDELTLVPLVPIVLNETLDFAMFARRSLERVEIQNLLGIELAPAIP
jgi:hypothetical protein